MTSVIFHHWFKQFCKLVKERTLILLYDDHMAHLDEETINFAKEENITVIKLPPHTTDVLQQLDKCCFRSLKYEWDLILVDWFRINCRTLQKSEFVNILCEVWQNGLKPDNIISGFRSTGIYPSDRTKYPVPRFDPEKFRRYQKNSNHFVSPTQMLESENQEQV